ncbi:MAG: hypothetical protein KAG94_00260 [Clostridiales bacterium]|nr:hypothetical protein [Clostridiales bacterium]
MNILFSLGKNKITNHYMNDDLYNQLSNFGHVTFNPYDRALTKSELTTMIRDIDILITHWAAPKIDSDVLLNANRLKLIAHGAGSIHGLVDECVFDKKITLLSTNKVMAKYVAETVLTNILSVYQQTEYFTSIMKNRNWKNSPDDYSRSKSLYGAKISFIGFGMVGHFLYNLLKPFNIQYLIYDPYLKDESFKITSSLDEALSFGDIVTIHASLTEETSGLLTKEKLSLIKDNALFVNSARGRIVDESALIDELVKNRFSAILDVYEQEPLSKESPLRQLPNVLAHPHTAGVAARYEFFQAIFNDVNSFIKKQPMQYTISKKQWSLMTRWPQSL